jgi:hypothetical protein
MAVTSLLGLSGSSTGFHRTTVDADCEVKNLDFQSTVGG